MDRRTVAPPSSKPSETNVIPDTQQRLRPGALHGLVEGFLIDRPAAEFTAGEIGRKLNRSSGALADTLISLTERGVAKQASAAPKRYTHVIEQAPDPAADGAYDRT